MESICWMRYNLERIKNNNREQSYNKIIWLFEITLRSIIFVMKK
ncbi:hypothetical protein kam1_959 [Methylacidiphilum kamchatkense Kam1]|uniref:Uncharacterized protein n=1 Tax=Methylacidiphilum kamchatkense Kam1 TaxID=1202785 RepID=A0A516TLS4_9BACT|nr:hypothetical protein kam1_959 [Methylacidiphilum kamchatkense Kam1]